MNTSKIIDMIKEDQTIKDNIPEFLQTVNEKNIEITVRSHVNVIDEIKIVSFSERNGGEATDRDVQDAIKLIAQEPLLLEAQKKYEEAVAAIQSGQVQSSSDLTNLLSNPILPEII